MGWDNLPQEILLQILENVREVSHIQLLECQLTCSSWCDTARRLFYEIIDLRAPIQALDMMNVITKHNLKKSVKKVVFESPLIESPEIEHILPTFFSNCKDITHIVTICEKHDDDSFFVKLIEEFHKGTLSKLQILPTAFLSKDSSIKIYGYLTMKFLNTLLEVQIWDWPQFAPSFENCCSSVSQKLPEFKSLKRLVVFVSGIYNATKIASLVKNCDSLYYIAIVNSPSRRLYYPIRDPEEELSLSDPVHAVEAIQTNMVLVTSNLLRQLMHSFPNLNHLSLNAWDELDFDPETSLDEDTSFIFRMQVEGLAIPSDLWIQFISYMYEKLDLHQLSILFFSDINRVLSPFIRGPYCYSALKIMYVRRNCVFDVQPYVVFSSNVSEIKIVYETKTVYRTRTERGSITSKLPHMDLLNKFGKHIYTLDISISPVAHFGEEEDSRHYHNASGYFLDHIFKRCTSLDTLFVTNAHLIACDPAFSSSKSIEQLNFLKCLICPVVLFEISERLQHCLSELLLGAVHFVTAAGQILTQRDKAIWIDMPFTNFSLLYFMSLDPIYGGYTQFNLKIQKGSNVFGYFVGTESRSFSKSSEAEYLQSLEENVNALIVTIHCSDLKYLHLHTRNFNIEINFYENDFEYTCRDIGQI